MRNIRAILKSYYHEQSQCVIDCDHVMRHVVKGVFARDQLPTNIENYPYGFIVNTDTGNLPGRHWLAFYYTSEDISEFFDSYGHSPEHFPFESSLQGRTSDVCGQYSLYYLLDRCRGVSMKTIVDQFGNNKEENDTFVHNFISNTFPYCFHYTCQYQACYAECK